MRSPHLRSLTEKLLSAVMLIVFVALAVGCGGGSRTSDTSSSAGGTCGDADRPPQKKVALDVPSERLDPDKTHVAKFVTSCGNFNIELDAVNNPKTASSFAYLIEKGVYNDTWFHRIITDFVVQGGDPQGLGTGDAGYKVVEKPSGKYKIGTVAMAKAADEPAGTSSSQFYIVVGEQGVSLPPEYAIAGRVVSGEDTIAKIAALSPGPEDASGTPKGVAVVETATLETPKQTPR